jgi:hypothetical protein
MQNIYFLSPSGLPIFFLFRFGNLKGIVMIPQIEPKPYIMCIVIKAQTTFKSDSLLSITTCLAKYNAKNKYRDISVNKNITIGLYIKVATKNITKLSAKNSGTKCLKRKPPPASHIVYGVHKPLLKDCWQSPLKVERLK